MIADLLSRFGIGSSEVPPDEIEEEAYAVAAQELRNGVVRQGLMAKAFADASGNEREAEALYIRFRASQLCAEIEEASERREQGVKADQKRAAESSEKHKRPESGTSQSQGVSSPTFKPASPRWVIVLVGLFLILLFGFIAGALESLTI
jgi:hypothetical protein